MYTWKTFEIICKIFMYFCNNQVDAYLSFSHSQHFNRSNKIDEQLTTQVNNNPVLPPKLYKSLTNLKINAATTTTTLTTTPTNATLTVANRRTTTSTLGRTTGSKQQQQQQPKMTFSISVVKNISPSVVTTAPTTLSPFNATKYALEHKNNTIYSSPNRHNLTKETTTTTSTTTSVLAHAKPSLHCTINNVVSKVPSVINIPNMQQKHENANTTTTTTTNKPEAKMNINNKTINSTTLPKKLNIKNSKMLTTSTTTTAAITATTTDSKMIIKNKNTHPSNTSTAVATTTTTTTINSNGTRTNNLLMAQTQSEDIASLNLLKVRPLKHLPVCTTTENCQNPREHYLPNDTSIDDDYLSECENCKIAQTAKYYLVDVKTRENSGSQRETMTLQRKSMDDAKEDQNLSGYYRVSHTLPSNSRKIAPLNNEPWFSTTSASSSSEEDAVD